MSRAELMERPPVWNSGRAEAMTRRDRLSAVIAGERRSFHTLRKFVERSRHSMKNDSLERAVEAQYATLCKLREHLDDFISLSRQIREFDRALESRRRGVLDFNCFSC